MLTGKYRKGQPLPESVRAQENSERRLNDHNFEIIEKVIEIANANSVSVPSVAVNWLRAKPWVSAPIIGANYPKQLLQMLSGLDTPITEAQLAELDEVSDFERSRTTLES